MKKIFLSLFFILTILTTSCFSLFLPNEVKGDGMFAVIDTTYGKIYCQLFFDKTPITVANFVGLSEGTREFEDPQTGRMATRPFYNGLKFHRVIENFVIQGGCPVGNGTGGPGYRFPDEFDQTLRHDTEGILSMANSGPNTNGSQFFITLAPTPHLDGKHTVFGKVVYGIDIVKRIGEARTDSQTGRPYTDIYINKIEIIRNGAAANSFNAETEFAKKDQLLENQRRLQQAQLSALLERLSINEQNLIKEDNGLQWITIRAGTGRTPVRGNTVRAHYTGYLSNGTVFDSSYQRNEPIEFPVGLGRVIPGWDIALQNMKEGEKRVLIIPHFLAYGNDGRPPIIPPMATLIFEVELVKIR